MKITKFILILFAFGGLSLMCYGETLTSKIMDGKINWQGSSPSSVAAQANKNYSFEPPPYSAIMQDPIVNSAINGYSNMIQGATGGSYNAVEQQKQQRDFVKQQIENPEE